MWHVRTFCHSFSRKKHCIVGIALCSLTTTFVVFAPDTWSGQEIHAVAEENYIELSDTLLKDSVSEITADNLKIDRFQIDTINNTTSFPINTWNLTTVQEQKVMFVLEQGVQKKCELARQNAEANRLLEIKKAAAKAEAEKTAKEEAAKEKAAKEKAAKEKAAKEKAAKEKAAKEKAAKEKAAKEKAAKEKAAKEKAAKEKAAKEKAAKEKAKRRISLSKSERTTLEKIVQAEAGNQDIKGRILVANVVINRMKNSEFPDTVKGVVFQHRGSSYQFQPVKTGSIHRVKVTANTRKAVQKALNGEDYSRGALYFVARPAANKKSLSWFDRCLTRLFTHGGHTFYK